MNTRLLMRTSAIFLAVLGLSATFLPQEILVRADAVPAGFSVVVVQIAGALYLGFAMLNWMAQGSMMGGIYGRPIAIGNFGHFTVAALALLKSIIAGRHAPEIVIVAAAYGVFACLFALVAFGRSPPSAAQ